ncbi:substrate-binding domain-containing protein [Nonomuraea antimicrobica]
MHTDDTAGGRLAAGHLLERGHRRFGFLGEAQISDRYVSPSQRRLEGYRVALADAGHPLRDEDVRLVRHRAREALSAAHELLSRPEHPTAVFAADDTLAAGVLRAARDVGLTVPRDVAVVGFDDGELAEVIDLTTIRQPLEESGRAAAERLIQQLDHRTTARDLALELELIVRGTT